MLLSRPTLHSAAERRESERTNARKNAMLDGPILQVMLGLALPTIIVLAAQTMVGLIETFYVSFLGTNALVGASLVFPILTLMTSMSNGGMGGGVAAAVARANGSGRGSNADALVLHAVVLAVAFGILFWLAALWCGPVLYRSLGGDGGALRTAVTYSTFVFAASIPIWIVSLLSAALRGAGDVRTPALVTLVGAVVLIPLSPALIFGIGPLHGLGIAGAGIAVTSYYTAASIVLLAYLMRDKRAAVRLKSGHLEWRLFADILGVGSIASLSTVQLNVTVILITGAVGRFGLTALAGYGIASRIDYLLIPLLFGLGTSVLTMVATNAAANSLARARRIAWIGTVVGAIFAELIGIAATVFPAAWIGLFSHDHAVIAAGAMYLRVVAPFYFAVGVTFVLNFASQGGGRPVWPFLAGTTRLLIAAGFGWFVVSRGASQIVLFQVVAAASVFSAGVASIATMAGRTIRSGRT